MFVKMNSYLNILELIEFLKLYLPNRCLDALVFKESLMFTIGANDILYFKADMIKVLNLKDKIRVLLCYKKNNNPCQKIITRRRMRHATCRGEMLPRTYVGFYVPFR